jgi:hypothetical protein
LRQKKKNWGQGKVHEGKREKEEML